MGEIAGLVAKAPEVKKSNSNSWVRRSERLQSMNTPVDRILFLQRTAGNQAVSRLMRLGTLQAKLKIGQPWDVYEQEADRVADAVMRMPEPGVRQQAKEEEEQIQTKPIMGKVTPLVQRQVKEEKEEGEEFLQTKAHSSQVTEVTSNIESRIQSLKEGGQPLSKTVRNYFESRFGQDFSQVRVHDDTNAADLAQSINAKAFTIGRNIVFGPGEYSTGTNKGKRLLAHELSHMVQQQVRGAGPMIFPQVRGRDLPSSVIHPCIDVRAQFALLRLFHGSKEDTRDAVELFQAVDSGQIIGIFGDDLAISARMATERGTVRWKHVPEGQDAVFLNDSLPDTPAIIFKEGLGLRLDQSVLQIYRDNRESFGSIPDVKAAPKCHVNLPPKKNAPPDKIVPPYKPPTSKTPPALMFGRCSTFLRPGGPGGTIYGVSASTELIFNAGTTIAIILENRTPYSTAIELMNLSTRRSVTVIIGPNPIFGSPSPPVHYIFPSIRGCVPILWAIQIKAFASKTVSPPSLPLFTIPPFTIPLPVRVSYEISSNSFLGEGPCCDL